MGVKNPMIMVDPDKAEEKFEKMATSITASTGEEEEKEGKCESIDQKLSDISKSIMEYGMGSTSTMKPSPQPKPDRPSPKPSPDVPSKPDTPNDGQDPLPKPDAPSKPIKKPKPISVMSSYDPISNKDILGVTEKILKKNFNLGEEGYDIARDEGRVKPAKDKKDGTSYPPSEEMKKTQKVNKGPSALEIIKKKYGKAVIDVDKKKKDKK